MTQYDVAMIVVLVGTTLWGIWKGAAWQIAALASVILSAAVAIHSSAALAPYFGSDERWNRFLAIAIIYVVTSAAIWIVFRLVSGIIDRVQLKDFDRQLGAILGLAKGVLYCVILTFFAVTLTEPSREAVLQSRSGDLIARGIRRANPILPDDVRTWLGEYIDRLDKELTPTDRPGQQGELPRPTPGTPAPAPAASKATPVAPQPTTAPPAPAKESRGVLRDLFKPKTPSK